MKQDPLLFGRNFSTTETLGRVILAKMSTQVADYQKIIASFLSDLFYTELILAGFNIEYVEVEFNPPLIGDKVKDEEAFGKKIENWDNLYKQGVVSQHDRARALGFEEADEEEPRFNSEFGNNGDGGLAPTDPTAKTDPDTESDATENSRVGIEMLFAELGGNCPEYVYNTSGCNCKIPTIVDFAKDEDSLSDFIKSYYKDVKKSFDKASEKVIKQIVRALSTLGVGASVDDVTDTIIYNLYKEWQSSFSKKQSRTIKKWVSAAYGFFRRDKSIFGQDMGDNIPNGVFGVIDTRVLEYFKDSDSLYLGKFITDEDLKKKVTSYIKKAYIEDRLPIGDKTSMIADFKAQFGDILNGQDWKLLRIISTTVSKLKNVAAVNYMHQAEVEEYEIVGVTDRLQCAYCKALQGTRFKVAESLAYIDDTVNSSPEVVKAAAPFITSIFKTPELMEGLSSSDLQAQGVHFPPYHPGCRDQAIAVL